MPHTPGPWIVNGSTVTGGDPIDDRGNRYESPICTVSNSYRNRETDKANAHLIAAAPELLGMLTDCEDFFCDLADKGYPTPLHARVRTLIAKAEGRQP